MKALTTLLAGILLIGSMAFAADTNSDEASAKTKKNPITGSTTTTKKMKKKHHNGDSKHDAEAKETKTVKKDGTTETKTEVTTETKH